METEINALNNVVRCYVALQKLIVLPIDSTIALWYATKMTFPYYHFLNDLYTITLYF